VNLIKLSAIDLKPIRDGMRFAQVLLAVIAVGGCARPDGAGSIAAADVALVGRFGSTDGPLTLRQIGSITLSPGTGDTLLLTQFQVPAILMLSSAGDSIGMIGRAGAGPGEFSTPLKPHFLNDTIWIADVSGSISRFAVGAGFVERLRPRIPPLGPNELNPSFVAPLSDGTLLFTASAGSASESRESDPTRALIRVDRQFGVLDTVLLRKLRSGSYFLTFPSGGGITGRHPVSLSDLMAMDPNGRWIVLVRQELSTPEGYGFSVEWIDAEGDTVGRHLVTSLRLPTSDLRDAWIDRLSASGAHSRAEVEKAAEDVPFPEFRPGAEEAFVDLTGRAWIRSPHAASDSARWYVVDQTRGPVAMFALPRRVRLLAAGPDFAWGWTPGPYDEPYVLKYRVEW
jgi:hypothetical protein